MKTFNSLTLPVLVILSILFLAACTGKEDKSSSQSEISRDFSQEEALRDSLDMAREYMNSLSALVNEVSDGMSEIKRMEQIVSVTDLSQETPDQRAKLRNDILLIKSAIQERQNKLVELEEKLTRAEAANNFNEQNKASMQQTINNLRQQLEEQQEMINDLTAKLESANTKIKVLNEKVDSLEVVNTQSRQDAKKAQEENQRNREQIERINNELNECYYAIGSKKELKDHKIIESGFLRKTKVLQNSNIMHSYFTKADKRTLNEIPLHSKKAKVLTTHNKLSYSIDEVNGMKVIKIHDPSQFWEYSNYLVVQVD